MGSYLLKKHQLPEPGDHLWVYKMGYSHHALYIGENEQGLPLVAHYTGWVDKLQGGPLALDSLDAFSAGKAIHVRQYPNRIYSPNETIERVLQRLGEDQYDVHTNNCEHLCHWAIMGDHRSKQVDWVDTVLGAIHPGLEAASKGVGTLRQPNGHFNLPRKKAVGSIAKNLAIDWGIKSAARWAVGPFGMAAYVSYRVSKQWLKQNKY